jgi:hypothetical protein
VTAAGGPSDHGERRLYLRSASDDPELAANVLARDVGLSLDAARAVLRRLPLVVPRRFSSDAAARIASRLRQAGVVVEDEPAEGLPSPACPRHAAFESYASCTTCKKAICSVCEAESGAASRCVECADERARKTRFQRIRIAILLGVLALVAVYAAADVHGRRARKDWDHTLSVAVVLLDQGGIDRAATERFKDRMPALEARLAAEASRWHPGTPKPFAIEVFGPVAIAAPPPPPPDEDGVIALAQHSWKTSRYYAPLDEQAGVATRAYDARIYVVVRPAQGAGSSFAEGSSEQDGRVGTVAVELGDGSVDLALVVVAHELFHTLGATDKYDAMGKVRRPEGLAEPELGNQQRFVEIMARTRPIGSEEKIPEWIDDIAVGPTTAQEIGWAR